MPHVEVALAVVVREREVLVGRRAEGAHLAGMWEFPGGKIEEGEEPRSAAVRELQEETGLLGGRIEPLLVHSYDYPDRAVRLHAFLVRDPEPTSAGSARERWQWIAIDALGSLALPPANAPIVQALRWRLGA